MYDLEQKGTIYITGKIGSFVSFFISQIKKKVFIFYDTDDEAFLNQEEIEYYTKKHAQLFPMYTDKVFEKEDEGKRISFLYHLVSDEISIPYYYKEKIFTPKLLIEQIKWFKRNGYKFIKLTEADYLLFNHEKATKTLVFPKQMLPYERYYSFFFLRLQI